VELIDHGIWQYIVPQITIQIVDALGYRVRCDDRKSASPLLVGGRNSVSGSILRVRAGPPASPSQPP
jgi:hypothetical protein